MLISKTKTTETMIVASDITEILATKFEFCTASACASGCGGATGAASLFSAI
jgi:hypothetical protein